MTSYSPLFLLGALGVLSAASTAAVAADTSEWKCSACPFPKGSTGTVDAGLGHVSDDSAKFGDYTGLNRQGAFLDLGGEVRYRGDNGFYADAVANNLGLDVRSVRAQVGLEGLYTVRLGYAEIPRYGSNDAMTPFLGNGGGVLSLPAGFPAGSTAAMPLAASLQPLSLESKRTRLDGGLTWIGGENWTYRFNLRHDVRDGMQRGAGSFFSTTSQLAIPVDQTTDQLEVAISYATPKLQATLGYQLSLFRNGGDSLTWANPFTPVVAGAGSGQLALAPDNEFHQIFGSAGYEISPTIRASADFAVGRMTQDAGYLAPSLNTNPAAGLPTLASLPAQSLHGRADTFNGNVKLSASPIDRLRLNASYARDVRDNLTASNSYPAVSTDMFLGAVPRSNLPYSFWQDRFKLNGDYRWPNSVKLSAGADQDNRQRSYQEVVKTHETTVWGRISGQPLENLSLALKLAHGDRSNSGSGVAQWTDPAQNPLMRKYNLADRQRDTAGLRADFAVNEKVSLGFNADYASDDYQQSVIGLLDGRSTNVGADIAVAFSEKLQGHAFVQSERVSSRQAGSQAYATPDWAASIKDKVDMLGIGVKHAAIIDKLDVGADLTFSRSHSDTTVETGVSGPMFPTASYSIDSLKLYGTYRLKDNLSVTGSFWHERYASSDWRLDGVMPATVSNLLAFGEQAPNYRVNVLRVAMRYRF